MSVATRPGQVDQLAQHVETLRAELRRRDPAGLAANTGATFRPGADALHLAVWGRDVVVPVPDFVAEDAATGAALDTMTQALLAYYFHTADGTVPAGAWIAFSELPDGAFYTQAFQGYTGRKLAQTFGNDVDAFAQAAVRAGARPVDFADRAFAFQVLPFVPLLVACWRGDEDFPSSYRILFDAAVGHHLPTDGCAILGSMLTRRLLREIGDR